MVRTDRWTKGKEVTIKRKEKNLETIHKELKWKGKGLDSAGCFSCMLWRPGFDPNTPYGGIWINDSHVMTCFSVKIRNPFLFMCEDTTEKNSTTRTPTIGQWVRCLSCTRPVRLLPWHPIWSHEHHQEQSLSAESGLSPEHLWGWLKNKQQHKEYSHQERRSENKIYFSKYLQPLLELCML